MPYHVHYLDYVIIYVTPSLITLMETPGSVKTTRKHEDGYVNYVSVPKPVAHQIRNESDISHRQILVEFKTLKGVAPTQNNHRVGEPL